MAEDDDLVDRLIDGVLREVEGMENDFAGWLEREAPRWRAHGYDETWIRLRMENAQAIRKLNRVMKAQGATEAQRRQAIQFALTGRPPHTPVMTPTPPENVQHAMTVLGVEMGATIFDVAPMLSREQFLVRVEVLIQHQFGHEFLLTQSQRARFAREHVVSVAMKEYKRLGGVWLKSHHHGKSKRHHRPSEQ